MVFNIGTYSFGMRSSATLAEKFKQAAGMGYGGIELLANELRQNSVEDIKKAADEAGIKIVSIHASLENADLLEKFAALGGKTFIVPGAPFSNKAEAYALADQLTELSKKAAAYGIYVGYHNHTTEFFEDEGKAIIEHVMDKADPAVFFQLDCGWAAAAGIKCEDFIRKHSGRFRAIHVKEANKVLGTGTPTPAGAKREGPPKMPMGPDGKPVMTPEMEKRMAEMKARTNGQCPMGDPSSIIDWHEIKKALDEQKLDEVFWTVERENDYAGNMLHCLKEDAAWLIENIK